MYICCCPGPQTNSYSVDLISGRLWPLQFSVDDTTTVTGHGPNVSRVPASVWRATRETAGRATAQVINADR